MNEKYANKEKESQAEVKSCKRKTDKDFDGQLPLGKAMLEAQRKIGNRAAIELLEKQYCDMELYKSNSSYYLDPIQSLSREITNKYFTKGSNLTQYIPKMAEQIPKQFMDISMDSGSITAGVIKGNGKAVLTAFLKNTAGQTATKADSRFIKESSASTTSVSDMKVLTNSTADSAVALILDIASDAKKIVQKMQWLIENEDQSPTGIETLDKLLPFISIKKDKEKLGLLSNELEGLNKGKENYSSKELDAIKSIIKKEIEEVKRTIARKVQKKKYFLQVFNKAWENIKKSEDDIYELKGSLPELADEGEGKEEEKQKEQNDTEEVSEEIIDTEDKTPDTEGDMNI